MKNSNALRALLISLIAGTGLSCGPRDPSSNNVTSSPASTGSGQQTGPGLPCAKASCACVTACHPRDSQLAWQPLPTEGAPSARRLHVAVWSGTEVLIWGGMVDGAGNGTASGAAYNPATDTWRAISDVAAPSSRHSHQAVWAGTQLLVWGGYAKGGYAKDGGAYDPATDTWTAIPEASISGRTRHSAVWTGTDLIVWGGLNAQGALGDGARYAVASKTWTALPGSGPKARASHVGVWTGTEMLVWGGTDTFDWFADGHHLDIAGNAWKAATNTTNAPTLRESSTGLLAAGTMLVWGGWNGGDYQNTGAAYEPTSRLWSELPDGAPEGRAGHVSLWTGDEFFVWGGCTGDSCSTLLGEGGRFTADDGWTKISANANLPPRTGALGVWTGKEVIVFGGSDANFKPLAGGARAAL